MKASASTEKVVNTLEKLVRKARGRLSPSDASAETGFSLQEVKDGLARLIELYECRVTMNSNTGALEFIFPYPLRQRGSKSFREIAISVLEAFWKVFKVIYKAAIGVILVLYTIIFVLILIGIMFGGGSDRDRDRGGIGDMIAGIFTAIFQGARIAAWTGAMEYAYDPYGNRYKQYRRETHKGKNFIQSVYHFVFGPERPKYDPLSDTKEAIAFIRKNNGRITAGQIIELTGVNYEEAESRLARYAVKFNGDLNITDDGIVIAEFPELLNKVNPDLEGGKIEFYIDEVDPPYEMNGNTSGRNTAIILMNTFNLIMSVYLINFFSNVQQIQVAVIGLGYFPFVFSVLFFIIPGIRYFYIQKKKAERERSVMRKRLLSSFISIPDQEVSFEYIADRARIEPPKRKFAAHVMEKLALDLQGDLHLDDNGEAVFTFPRLSKELLV